MNLNLLTKKLYQLSVDKFGTLFSISILIFSLFFVSLNVKAQLTNTCLPGQICVSDPITNSDFVGKDGLRIVSNEINVEGCKGKAGGTTGKGYIAAFQDGGGSGGGPVQGAVICKPDNVNSTFWNNLRSASTKVFTSGIVFGATSTEWFKTQMFKVVLPAAAYTVGGVNILAKNIKDYNTTFGSTTQTNTDPCTIQSNANLPFCQTSGQTTFNQIKEKSQQLNLKVQTTVNTSVDFATSVTFNTCYYQGSPSGDQSKLISVDEGKPTSSFKCQCITIKKSDGSYKWIQYVNPDGTLKDIYKGTLVTNPDGNRLNSDGSLNSDYDIYKNQCLDGVLIGTGTPSQIGDGRFFGPRTLKCYATLDSCKLAEGTVDECPEDKNGSYFFIPTGSTRYTEIGFSALVSKYKQCSNSATTSNICKEMNSARRCNCSINNNPNYDPIFCATPLAGTLKDWWDASCTDKVCLLQAVNLQVQETRPPESPLAFINVLVNVLFWLAVLLFIINFITAGIEMVRSGDEPEKMKEATGRITSSIFGFIFILIISGLINYLIDFVETFLTKR